MFYVDVEEEVFGLLCQLVLWIVYLTNIGVLDVLELGVWDYDVLLTLFACVSLEVKAISHHVYIASVRHILVLGLSHHFLKTCHFFLWDCASFLLHIKLIHHIKQTTSSLVGTLSILIILLSIDLNLLKQLTIHRPLILYRDHFDPNRLLIYAYKVKYLRKSLVFELFDE